MSSGISNWRHNTRSFSATANVAVKIFSKRRHPQDRGLGDTVHRLLGGDAFPTWFFAVFGRDCGCADRQRWLNERFPFPAAGQRGGLTEAPSAGAGVISGAAPDGVALPSPTDAAGS